MAVSNEVIAESFSRLSKLMDIHGENPFKIKSYAAASFSIDKLTEELSAIPREKIMSIKGIGPSIGKQIIEILDTGELPQLHEITAKTPPGVIEMLRIKGLGPKKISTVWKEMEIESIGELMYACDENRLMLYKGFGEKTQHNIRETIAFYLRSQGSFLFAEVEGYVLSIHKKLHESFPGELISITGAFRRQLEIINQAVWITSLPFSSLIPFFTTHKFLIEEEKPDELLISGQENIKLKFQIVTHDSFHSRLFETSCSETFLDYWKQQFKLNTAVQSEEMIFQQAGIHFIPAPLRENPVIIEKARLSPLPPLIKFSDVKGIIHSHSNWSDGLNTVEEMAKACIEQGFEYLVISDHSKSAFYANGLSEERIREQHLYVDELNTKLAPFHIFKSIECDILNDGRLDYSDQILSTFDLVIASVHSNLKMSEEKAMNRLLTAIQNPHTRILGHPTGRLLLSRAGYPVDHKTLIEACAVHGVVIELNAHPRRLDMDWRWIDYALQKNVLISIDPDVHSITGYHDIHYGVLAAQKGGVTAANNLSSFTLKKMKEFVSKKRYS
ncbi:MAG TPA: helix-hairpin-helix domain-containing protein [Puia sp.]|jgi:DNA polymerase (family 10)|nr:helix-hairpin-helix domain-containing protein [Puia sp.]